MQHSLAMFDFKLFISIPYLSFCLLFFQIQCFGGFNIMVLKSFAESKTHSNF